MPSEREYQIHPIVPDSVVHNTKVSFVAQSWSGMLRRQPRTAQLFLI